MLFAQLLERLIQVGSLTVIDANGRTHTFTGDLPGRSCTIRLHDKALHYRALLNPYLCIGEAYIDGTLTVEDTDLYEFVALCEINMGWSNSVHWLPRLRHAISLIGRRVTQRNPAPRARHNVAHHYDLSGRLYEIFLDSDRQYSCAYFVEPDDGLEQAQCRKKQHLAAKLLLAPGQKVLDIGSGWGGLAISLAKLADIEVTGITLSTEQHAYANQRAEREGLADRVKFMLKDYRQIRGRFDRIVSVGMFEHVGIGYYDVFFGCVRDLLVEDGIALLHTVGRAMGPGAMNPWMDKYIFPGAYPPALSEVTPVIERKGLYITDIEILRLHYAETLKAWRERFMANREKVLGLYDDRFCRMWELYLASCEAAFRYGGFLNFQVQMAKQQDAVPLVRDYVTDFERAVASAEWRAA